jgi:N-acyl-D-amino-acid deacylase
MDKNGIKYDLVLRGGTVIDGTGAPRIKADVGIDDDRIATVGDIPPGAGAREEDVTGLIVAPGFIDAHTHDDRLLLSDPTVACKASQGVTTVVTGNCGVSLAPLDLSGPPPPPLDLISPLAEGFFAEFSDYLSALDKDPPAINALCQVGHSSLRAGAMDSLDRPATDSEVKTMRGRLEKALEAGAIGFSTGLAYAPSFAAPTEEVIKLAKAVNASGGIHTTHMRDESEGVIGSLDETFHIGREAGVPIVISHMKCSGHASHGRSPEALAHINAALPGQSIAMDVYPYAASSTILDIDFIEGAETVLITWSKGMPEMAGRNLFEVADEMGLSVDDTIAALRPAGAVYFSMLEDDVRRFLASPSAMIGSDGLPHDEVPHPRLWGTFPRVLGHYARDEGLFSLEDAVRKMTSLPASRFGLGDRGIVQGGAVADLVVFDADTIIDSATFADPKQPARGIHLVMVGGREVWKDGAATGARPGRAIRGHELSPAQVS